MSVVASNRQLKVIDNYDKFRGQIYLWLRKPYLVAALCGYAFVILLVSFYLSLPQKFKSDMDLVLPGTGASSNVSLDEVGQVISQTSTPFGGGGFNPRVNYKEMLSSRGVLQRAANKVNLSLEQFGEAKVKLTEQTSILEISMTGATPDQAQQKAWELYYSLQEELDQLRADEVNRRDESIKRVLEQYRIRLNTARANIVDFQQRSLLVTADQLDQLVATHSQKRAQYLDVSTQIADLTRYVSQLSIDIGVSPVLAGKALKLQSDAEYKGYIAEMDNSSSRLSEFRSRWGANHPKVVAETLRFEQSKKELLKRSTYLIGGHANDLFGALSLDATPKRAQLFSDLISAYAKQQGLEAKKQELNRVVLHMADQLKVYTREFAELDRLQREFDLAEAVFTSAAARLEAGKADVFASYPVVQLLTSPSQPVLAVSPKPAIAIAAAIAGILFISLGVVVIWQRHTLINLLLKKS